MIKQAITACEISALAAMMAQREDLAVMAKILAAGLKVLQNWFGARH